MRLHKWGLSLGLGAGFMQKKGLGLRPKGLKALVKKDYFLGFLKDFLRIFRVPIRLKKEF